MKFNWVIPPGAEEIHGSVRVKPEALVQIQIVRAIREQVIKNGAPVMWLAVPNQLEISGKAAMALYILRRMMGMVKGTSDLIIAVRGRMIAMEVKTTGNSPREDQLNFAEWCRRCSVPYHVVYGPAEAIDIITSYLMETN